MNTLHFKYAVEVEKTGSITQAAGNLFMAQPNLSKAIKELEDTLGITIFERTSKGVIPTQQGREFLEYAKQILQQLDKMESIYIPKSELELRQSLKISVPRGSYISEAFSNMLHDLDMNKNIDMEIKETNSVQTVYSVADNNYNLGVVRYQMSYENYFLDFLKEKNLDYETIWDFSCLVLMSDKHQLANEEILDYEKLKNSSIELIHADNVVPYLITDDNNKRTYEENGSSYKRIYVYERGSQFDLLSKVPHTFMWVSPIPQRLLDIYGLRQRKCETPNNFFRDVLIYRRGYKLTKMDKTFLNNLYAVKNDLAFSEWN